MNNLISMGVLFFGNVWQGLDYKKLGFSKEMKKLVSWSWIIESRNLFADR